MVRLAPNLTLTQHGRLLWGKIRRYYLITFRRGYVNASLARRRGECGRSGTCCKLLYVCPFLDESSGETRCRNYHRRPGNCRLFPIDERDIEERNFVSPCVSCGFSFVPAPEIVETKPNAHPAPPHAAEKPVRMGV